MLNQRVKVSSGTYLAPPIVNVVQNDTGRVLVCEPFDYTITGAETATLICRRPDDTIFTYTGTVNADDNDVSIPMATEGGALTQVGDVDAELILTASGATITSFKITIRVQEDISGEATPEEKTFVAQLVAEVDASFAEYQAALNDVEEQLDDLVPKTTKVNGKALSSDITLAPSDLGAVPETRTVNGHELDENVELDADDVGAVPEERTVNNYPLDDDVNVMAVDIPFTPNGSLTSDNVQDAIDEVRDMVEVGHETVLYTSSATSIAAGTYLLDDTVANYQYLDIYTSFSGYNEIRRIPVDDGQSYSLRFLNLADSDSSTFVGWSEISLSFSGAVMTVNHNKYVNWSGKVNSDAVVASSGKPYIIKVMGIKYDALGSGGGGSTIVVDDQLSPNSTNPVQNKVLYDAIRSGGGFSNAAKIALLNCFANVAWIGDDGQQYYDALYDALYPETPPAQLVSITAVFTQGAAVIDENDSLDDLKQYLVVTAEYDDSTTEEVTNYVLSGTLTKGTSTITVSYGGLTTTFTVTVSGWRTLVDADIATHIGATVSVDGTGTITGTNLQDFFVIALNSVIKKIRGVAVAKIQPIQVRYSPKYVFEGPNSGDYYGVNPGDPNSSTAPTQVFQFVNASTKYTVTKLSDYTTITPSDWLPLHNISVWDYDGNFEVDISTGNMVITNLDTSEVVSIDGADVIGFWGSSYSDLVWLKNIQIYE